MEQQDGRTSPCQKFLNPSISSLFPRAANIKIRDFVCHKQLLLEMVGIPSDPPTLWTCIIWFIDDDDDGWAVQCPDEPVSNSQSLSCSSSRLPRELQFTGQ